MFRSGVVGLLLCSLCSGWLIEPLASVDVEVLDNHFVRLPLGNPQHTYTMILDLQASDILFSSYHPEVELHSNSFEADAGSGQRSDLFSLGSYTLRLPYHFGTLTYDRSVQLSSQQAPIGRLGLGEHSPLWRYWGNFSLTSERLRLGERDQFGAHQSSRSLPVMHNLLGYTENPDTGTGAAMLVNFSLLDLLLPHQLLDEKPDTLLFRSCSDPELCPESTQFALQSQEIWLLSGITYVAIDQSHDGLVHLGRRFFYEARLFCEWSSASLVFSELVEISGNFNSLYATALALLLWLWLTTRLEHRKFEALEQTEQILNSLLEVLIFELTFAAWITNFFIFHWSLALLELLGDRAIYAEIFVHASLCGGLLLALLLHFYQVRYKFAWHMLAVANTVLPAVWSGFVQHHHIFADVGFLLFFSTTLALVNGVIFTVAILFRKLRLGIVSGLATASSYAFLCVCNLLPVHEVMVVGQHIGLFIAEYLLLFLLIPTLLISMRILLDFAQQYQPKKGTSRGKSKRSDTEPPDVNIYNTFTAVEMGVY